MKLEVTVVEYATDSREVPG